MGNPETDRARSEYMMLELEEAVRRVIETLVMRPEDGTPLYRLTAWATLYDAAVSKLAVALKDAQAQLGATVSGRVAAEAERELVRAGWDVWLDKTLTTPPLSDRLRRLVEAYDAYMAAKYPRSTVLHATGWVVAPAETDAFERPARENELILEPDAVGAGR